MESTKNINIDFLSGGGEMGELIRSLDWSKTPLGKVENWPQSLKTTVSILLNSGYPMFIWWSTKLINLYNDAYAPILGAKHPAALGRPANEVWSEIWAQGIEARAKIVFQGKPTYDEDLMLIMERKGYKEEAYFTFSYSPILDDDGAVAGLFCACTEETKKVTGERQLHTLKDLGKKLFDCKTIHEVFKNTIAVLSENPQDFPFALVYELKESNAILTGHSEMGVAIKKIPDEIDISASNEMGLLIAEAIATKNPVVIKDIQKKIGDLPAGVWATPPDKALLVPVALRGQKPYGFLNIGLNPHRTLDEKYAGFFTLVADQVATAISNAKAYEEERKRAEALAEIDKAKTVFFNNISHEFRTPLTLMLGPLEEVLANNNILDVRLKEAISLSHRNAQRMMKLVNNLLDFSRIEAGRIEAFYEPVHLSALTTDLASSFRSAIEKAGIEFIVDCPTLSKDVWVDKDMWEKIVLNLLSNAYKYTLKGQIIVRLREESEMVKLTVADTGVGIPKEELPKIFDRFHRVNNAKGRTFEGSGIGLSLVKELVKLQEGTIEVKSMVDEGTSFVVNIPFKSKENKTKNKQNGHSTGSILSSFTQEASRWTSTETKKQTKERKLGTEKKHVLLADDNADMRYYINKLLGSDYEVNAVPDGKAAWESIQEDSPDLVISDIMMPEVNGFELVKKIRSQISTANIPVIFLSGRAGEEAVMEGLEAGADDYLVKPFTAKELLTRVDSNIRLFEARANAQKQLNDFFMQAPAAIAVVEGPQQKFVLANSLYQKLFNRTEKQLIGKTIRDVFTEMEGQGIYEIFENVYRSGEPFIAGEYPAVFDRTGKGVYEKAYFNFVAQPMTNLKGTTSAVMIHAIEVTAQVDARKKIEENEDKYRSIFETAGVSLWEEDFSAVKAAIDELKHQGVKNFRKYFSDHPEFVEKAMRLIKVLDVNEATVKMFEAENKSDLLGSLPKIFIPESFHVFVEELITVAEGHAYLEAEALLNTVKGNPVHVIFTMKLPSLLEKFDRVLFSVLNITERKQAEEKTRESEERFRSMAREAPLFVWVTDEKMQTTFLNRTGLDYFNLDESIHVANISWKKFIHPEDIERVLMTKNDAAKNNQPYTLEMRLKNGGSNKYRWFLDKGVPRYKNDKFIGFIGTSLDIHDRKEAEELLEQRVEERTRQIADKSSELQQQKDFVEAILASSKDLIAVFDADMKYMLVNKAVEEIYQLDAEKFVGEYILDVFPQIKDSEMFLSLQRCLQGELVYNKEFKSTLTGRWLQNYYVPLKNTEGEIYSAVVIGHDITDIVEAAEEVKTKNGELENTITMLRNQELKDQQKDSFMQMASHELKTPLTSIKAYSQLLAKNYAATDDVFLKNGLTKVENQVDKMTKLVNDLLNLTRIESGKFSMDKERINIADVVGEIASDFQMVTESHRIEVEKTGPVYVMADKEKIAQVLVNFLNNAVKYSPDSKDISVKIEKTNGFVTVSVIDKGIGINQAEHDKIFERFYRVASNRTAAFSGFGIGLYICADIIRRHDGKIGVKSKEGKGAVFYFTLPQV